MLCPTRRASGARRPALCSSIWSGILCAWKARSRPERELRSGPRRAPATPMPSPSCTTASIPRRTGFGPRFTAYVADGMAELVRALEHDPSAGRLWLAEVDGHLKGSIAIVRAAPTVAQLRWFLLAPELRGRGLGRHLLDQALAYAASNAYESLVLLTVKGLDRAAKLYRAAGFVLTDERPGAPWAGQAIEQRYELRLSQRGAVRGAEPLRQSETPVGGVVGVCANRSALGRSSREYARSSVLGIVGLPLLVALVASQIFPSIPLVPGARPRGPLHSYSGSEAVAHGCGRWC